MTLNLKFLRIQNGMTLEQLAADSGLTRSYLSKLERGLSPSAFRASSTASSSSGLCSACSASLQYLSN